ncbi:MAG TPA: DCC1-like thiol-disulfide oxidoreductase family protein [Bryobacteraceae bacterium]|nr:DCC1-like thiol-disulfide oxidoreductase family protein [Bryobacteraceae bacterium]
MAAAISHPENLAKPSWNPLRCAGTALPANLLVMAKTIAIALLLTNHVKLLPRPFLPFLPWLDRIPGIVFQDTLRVAFLVSAVALLFNRSVRLSSFLLGMTMLAGVVASKAYYGNNKTFTGLILVLTGLYEPKRGPWLLRLQLVVVYFGAGLNKVLDPDWRTGVFFSNWAVNRLHQAAYLYLASFVPSVLLAQIMSWFTIVTELSLSGIFLVRRLFPLGIWLSILLHSGMVFFTGSTFTMFFYAMTASMLVFISWPESPLTVIYDGDCGFCTRTKQWFERFDLDGLFHWRTYASEAGIASGIFAHDAAQRVYLIDGARIYAGFRAFRMLVLYNPISYLLVYALVASEGRDGSKLREVTIGLLLLVFSPLFTPIGEAMYRWIARNRYRLSAQPTCRVD